MAAARHARPDTVYNGDCIRGMEAVDDSTVDLIVTDPPFGIGFGAAKANYNRSASFVLDGYGEVGAGDDYYRFSLAWMRQAYRVLKDTGSMYVFSGWNNLKDVLAALDDTGFKTVNHLVWRY